MPIVVPNFNTTALITGSTLISDADNQLNILMDDVTNYVENTYDAIASSIEGTVATDAASALASANLAEKWASEVEDTPVTTGKYSAFHWSQKAFNTVFASSQHILRVDNPHSVTKSQVGLGNAENTADIAKNVLSATKLTTPRNIALTGDITGSVNFDGSSNVSITATVTPNSVALGSDTTGNYVAGNTAGTGITVSGTAGEAWSPTIAITNIGTAGTYRSITTNAQGQVISGTNPTTIADYGITDAYTKTQIDAIAQGLSAKASVLVASTSALVFNSAISIIDGITLTASDRVLVKDQTNQAQNGIYTNITTTSWTRTSDADNTLELKSAYVFVDSGAINTDTAWVQINDIITIGTTPITWVKFAGAGAYSPIGHLHSTSDITSGILPVIRGGTGVTTSTGSGNNVLSTSPILTTPSLGVATGTSFNAITGLATVAPLDAGIASIGTSTAVARQDHKHAVQTTVSGNASTATTLQTPRTITIGNTGKTFDGSANVSFSISDIGAQPIDADLTAISTLVGTTGLLKKTATDTWTLDTNTYVTSSGVTSIATSGAITGGTITSTGTISHSTTDGYLHVPATGTISNGKVLTAGATAGSFSWATPTPGVDAYTKIEVDNIIGDINSALDAINGVVI